MVATRWSVLGHAVQNGVMYAERQLEITLIFARLLIAITPRQLGVALSVLCGPMIQKWTQFEYGEQQ
jgi:hypothetical protein